MVTTTRGTATERVRVWGAEGHTGVTGDVPEVCCTGSLSYSLKCTNAYGVLFCIYDFFQQKDNDISQLHLTFGNKILYWYHLMSKT